MPVVVSDHNAGGGGGGSGGYGGLGGGFQGPNGDISPLTGEEDQDLSLILPLLFKQACYGWWWWSW
jgi:hypothetical protein